MIQTIKQQILQVTQVAPWLIKYLIDKLNFQEHGTHYKNWYSLNIPNPIVLLSQEELNEFLTEDTGKVRVFITVNTEGTLNVVVKIYNK